MSFNSFQLQVAKFQDRVKYVDSQKPKEYGAIQIFEAELKNSETRIRALTQINHAYKKIINVMLQVLDNAMH